MPDWEAASQTSAFNSKQKKIPSQCSSMLSTVTSASKGETRAFPMPSERFRCHPNCSDAMRFFRCQANVSDATRTFPMPCELRCQANVSDATRFFPMSCALFRCQAKVSHATRTCPMSRVFSDAMRTFPMPCEFFRCNANALRRQFLRRLGALPLAAPCGAPKCCVMPPPNAV